MCRRSERCFFFGVSFKALCASLIDTPYANSKQVRNVLKADKRYNMLYKMLLIFSHPEWAKGEGTYCLHMTLMELLADKNALNIFSFMFKLT